MTAAGEEIVWALTARAARRAKRDLENISFRFVLIDIIRETAWGDSLS